MSSSDPAPLWLRIAAIFYDLFILTAIWMVTAALVLLAFHGEVDVAHQPPLYHAVLQITLFSLTTFYFVISWRRVGQTIGMRAWRVRVVDESGQLATSKQCLLRYAVALASWLALGAGYIWCLVDHDRRGWHDIASKTRLVRVPKH